MESLKLLLDLWLAPRHNNININKEAPTYVSLKTASCRMSSICYIIKHLIHRYCATDHEWCKVFSLQVLRNPVCTLFTTFMRSSKWLMQCSNAILILNYDNTITEEIWSFNDVLSTGERYETQETSWSFAGVSPNSVHCLMDTMAVSYFSCNRHRKH